MSKARLLTILVALAGLGSLGVIQSRLAFSQASNAELMILSTAAQQGELAPCG